MGSRMDGDIGLPPEQLIHGSCRETRGEGGGDGGDGEAGARWIVGRVWSSRRAETVDWQAVGQTSGKTNNQKSPGTRQLSGRDAGTAKQQATSAGSESDRGVGARMWLMRRPANRRADV